MSVDTLAPYLDVLVNDVLANDVPVNRPAHILVRRGGVLEGCLSERIDRSSSNAVGR